MIDHAAVLLALRARLLTVAGIPAKGSRAWENIDFVPVTNAVYLEEDYVPAASTLRSFATNGMIEVTGLYVVRYYGLSNTGIGSMWAVVNAILAAFLPGDAIDLGASDQLRIRADVAPYAGQIRPTDSGHACITITIPWRLFTPKS